MLVAIPSKGRAGKTKSDRLMKRSGVLFVPDNEVRQYEMFSKNVVGVPDEVRGITKTRNWILKNNPDQDVVFVDDDVKRVGYYHLFPERCKEIKTPNEAFLLGEFEKWFELTAQLDWKIWGAKTEGSLRSQLAFYPIRMKSYVTASCMGIINDGTYYFNEDYPVKEDYEICLRHIKERGGILSIQYMHWENEHWETEGGCKAYRTIQMEKDAIKRLIRDYPGIVKQVKRVANEFTIRLYM